MATSLHGCSRLSVGGNGQHTAASCPGSTADPAQPAVTCWVRLAAPARLPVGSCARRPSFPAAPAPAACAAGLFSKWSDTVILTQ